LASEERCDHTQEEASTIYVKEVETFHDFERLLRVLSSGESGMQLYMPLHRKFLELLARYRLFLRLALLSGFVLGVVFGIVLPL